MLKRSIDAEPVIALNWWMVKDIDYTNIRDWSEADIERVVSILAEAKYQRMVKATANRRPLKSDPDLMYYRADCWSMTRLHINKKIDAAWKGRE